MNVRLPTYSSRWKFSLSVAILPPLSPPLPLQAVHTLAAAV